MRTQLFSSTNVIVTVNQDDTVYIAKTDLFISFKPNGGL